MGKLKIFIQRMKKIGIDIEINGNYPWVYIDSINGNKIKEEDFYNSDYGYTIAFLPIRHIEKLELLDINKTINLIRKYIKVDQKSQTKT